MKNEEYRYCLVDVYSSDLLTFFKSDDKSICENSYVKIPYGDTISVGIVVRVQYYTLSTAPFSPKQTQSIIAKITKEEFDKYTQEDENNEENAIDLDELKSYIKKKEYGNIFQWASEHIGSESQAMVNEAVKCYKICLKQNVTSAAEMLGKLYKNGDGVEQDYSKAYEYFKIANEGGSVDALVELGLMEMEGKVGEPNYAKAYERFSQAALVSNDVTALCMIGDMYLNGYYLKQDNNLAYALYERALGVLTPADEDEAIFTEVLKRVGKCMAYGIGVGVDLEMAHSALAKALNGYYRNSKAPEARKNIAEVKEIIAHVESEIESQLPVDDNMYKYKN